MSEISKDPSVTFVPLTPEQFSSAVYFADFVKSLCCFVDESAVDIDAKSITTMLFCAAADFEKSLGVALSDVE